MSIPVANPLPSATTTTEPLRIAHKSMNVERLRDAIEMATEVLRRNVTAPVIRFLTSVFVDEIRKPSHKGCADLVAFQQYLKEIPKWNSVQIESATSRVISQIQHSTNFRLYETIKFILVGKVFIITSVTNTDEQTPLSISIPTLNDYMHRVLSIVAKELFIVPSIIRPSPDHLDTQRATNHSLLVRIVEKAIHDAITDLIPHDHIFDTYLADTMKGVHFEASTPEQQQPPPQSQVPDVQPLPESITTSAAPEPLPTTTTPISTADNTVPQTATSGTRASPRAMTAGETTTDSTVEKDQIPVRESKSPQKEMPPSESESEEEQPISPVKKSGRSKIPKTPKAPKASKKPKRETKIQKKSEKHKGKHAHKKREWTDSEDSESSSESDSDVTVSDSDSDSHERAVAPKTRKVVLPTAI